MKKIFTQSIIAALVLLCIAHTANAQWENLNGPNSGGITCFFQHGTDLFAGTIKNGIFMSENNGKTWTQKKPDIVHGRVTSIVSQGPNLIAGTDSGIYLSYNNGTQWTKVDTIKTASLVVSGSDIFACSERWVFRSIDGAITWTPCKNEGLIEGLINTLTMIDTDLFAASDQYQVGIYRSTNKGDSWVQVNTGLTDSALLWTSSLAAIGTILYAGTADNIFRSTNKGANWASTVPLPFPTNNVVVSCFAADGKNICVGTNAGILYLSTNDGASWENIYNNFDYMFDIWGSINSVVVSGSHIFVGSENTGVFTHSSDLGIHWTTESAGLPKLSSSDLSAFGDAVYVEDERGFPFLSRDNGVNWTPRRFDYPHKFFLDGNDLIGAGWISGEIFYSTDGGKIWEKSPDAVVSFTSCVKKDSLLFASGYEAIYESPNHGRNWKSINNDLPIYTTVDTNKEWVSTGHGTGYWRSTPVYHMHYTSIDLIVSNGEYLIGATNKGLYRSTNNGENWTKAGAPFDSLPASNLAVIGTNIFALTGAGVFRSTDNGSTWENRYDTSGYNHPQLLSVSGVSLFVVSYYKGVFLSIDSGLTWKNVSENLPKTFETSISDSIVSIYPSCISSNDTYLYIGTEMSSGLWRRPLAEMIPASLLRKHPSQFESNFPNPFSTSTTITFRLTNSSFVELEVYDVLGRKVRTLLSETLEAGPHSVVFDAKDLAQGVYVARLRSEGTNQDLKMVVVGK